MALLVFVNRTPTGPGTDYPEVGDVIAVLPEGRSPGTKVTVDAGFYQIRVPGDPERWNHLLEPVVSKVDRGDGELIDHATKFRARRLRVSPTLRQRLDRGVLEVDVTEVDALIETKSG